MNVSYAHTIQLSWVLIGCCWMTDEVHIYGPSDWWELQLTLDLYITCITTHWCSYYKSYNVGTWPYLNTTDVHLNKCMGIYTTLPYIQPRHVEVHNFSMSSSTWFEYWFSINYTIHRRDYLGDYIYSPLIDTAQCLHETIDTIPAISSHHLHNKWVTYSN